MPYELFLAIRYFYSRRRRTLARVTSLVAIAGVAFGVAILIVAISLANGFRDEMRDKILNGSAHITVTSRDGSALDNWQQTAARIVRLPGVVGVYPTTYDGSMVVGPAGSSYGMLRGVSGDAPRVIENIHHTLIGGSSDFLSDPEPPVSGNDRESGASGSKNETSAPSTDGPDLQRFAAIPSEAAIPQAIIGSELATRTGLTTGDLATVVSAEPAITPLGIAPRYRKVKIAGVFRSGLFEFDSTWVYVRLGDASEFAERAKGSAGFLSIETDDAYHAAEVAGRIRTELGDTFVAVSWQEANSQLFAALALERRMGVFILGLIVAIGILNVTSTLVLVVAERRSDIAILKAMGAGTGSVMAIFVLEGGAIGLVGAIAGIVMGWIATAAGNHFKLVSLPSEVYSVGNVPFHPHLAEMAVIGTVALGLSLLATIYPARTAARMRPVEGLQS